MKWNLKEIYSTNIEYYLEIEKLIDSLKTIKNFDFDNISPYTFEDLLKEKYKILKLKNKILLYATLKYYKNMNDSENQNHKFLAENISFEVEETISFIDKKIIELDLIKVEEYIRKNTNLNIYKFELYELFEYKKHITYDINRKQNILKKIEENIKLYEMLTDKTYNAKIVTKEQIEEFTKILSTLKELKNEIACLENYDSILEKTLFEDKIDSNIIRYLINSVHDNLYLIEKYFKLKFSYLNIENPSISDLGLPIENVETYYSLDEAKYLIIEALKPLGETYISVVKELFNGHIDAEFDENKHQSVTFSWDTYAFTNFRGTYYDLKRLVHEIGHIVNNSFSKKTQPIYEENFTLIGEVAAMVNEILLNRYLFIHANNNSKKLYFLSKNIENYITAIYNQTLYTEFEDKLYEMEIQDSHDVSEKYIEIFKLYYGNVIDKESFPSTEWTKLDHIFRYSYYNYNYACGLLISSIIVESLLDSTLSSEDYIEFLSYGSSSYPKDILKHLNIDITNNGIFETGFNLIFHDIEHLEEILSLNKTIVK